MAALVSLLIVVDDGGGLIISMASKFNGEKDYGNLWIGRTKNMLDRLNSALPGGRLTRFGQFTKNIFLISSLRVTLHSRSCVFFSR